MVKIIVNMLILYLITQESMGGYKENPSNNDDFTIDYVMANKNSKNYDQVPKGELIWGKYMALEPMNIYGPKLRGRGFLEPLINSIINRIRKEHHSVYVDYFTPAKSQFYSENKGYFICGSYTRSFHLYKKVQIALKRNNFINEGKYEIFSVPQAIFPAISFIGISQKKRHKFLKHLWKNTNVYNIKSILDDEDLYTTQIISRSSAIKQYIYDTSNHLMLFPKYKNRVYEFVASNEIQNTLMLNANRMDYTDMLFSGDFYVKQLKIPEEKVLIAKQSHVHPSRITKEDLLVSFVGCQGENLKELMIYMKIINNEIKKIRSNYNFWSIVLRNYSHDMKIPYESPNEFFYTQETFTHKKDLDIGYFDVENF